MAAAWLLPSKSCTRTCISNWQHSGKGILGNVVHSNQVDTLQSHHSLLFAILELRHIFSNYTYFPNKNNNEIMPNMIHLFVHTTATWFTLSPEDNTKFLFLWKMFILFLVQLENYGLCAKFISQLDFVQPVSKNF